MKSHLRLIAHTGVELATTARSDSDHAVPTHLFARLTRNGSRGSGNRSIADTAPHWYGERSHAVAICHFHTPSTCIMRVTDSAQCNNKTEHCIGKVAASTNGDLKCQFNTKYNK